MKDDRITLEGKAYISSALAAKEMRYTKDYIGQLARAGKINAKLIGRSWYVLEDSIKEHKDSVHYTLTKSKKKKGSKVSRDTEKVNVHIDNSSTIQNTETVPEEVHTESGSPLPTFPSLEDERHVEEHDASPVLSIPIRTVRRGHGIDPLVAADVHYEPGEPIYYEDDGPMYPQVQREVARNDRSTPTPRLASETPYTSTKRSPAPLTRAPIRSAPARVPASPSVPMDGVMLHTPAATRQKDRVPYTRPQPGHYANRASASYEVASYGAPRRPKQHTSLLLIFLITAVFVAGFAAIAWVLFGSSLV